MINEKKIVLNYPMFDGNSIIPDASVIVKDGRIEAIGRSEKTDTDYFLMPGLIDAHTHMNTMAQVNALLKRGVTATCDVAASDALIERSKKLRIISSAGMTMGTLNGKSYVINAVENGAAYIKVLLMEPNLMLKGVLKDICNTAHDYGKKVAVHAVSVKAVKMAASCGADILLHVPMKETFPVELAEMLADKGVTVAPTLVMMEAFANSGRNGYKKEHYLNAQSAVRLLYDTGVQLLVATDANDGSFAPPVEYGVSMHREMQLLAKAGVKTTDILAGATGKTAKVFDIAEAGHISVGKRATMLLVEGRPDKDIADISKIKQIWIDGEDIL